MIKLNNRIVILGGAGFIGFHLAKKFAHANNSNVLLVDNFIRGEKDSEFEQLISLSNVEVINADLSREEALEGLFHFNDIVINCAALNGTQNFYQVPLDVLRNSAITAYLCAEYAARAKVHNYIYLGSSESYAGGVNLGIVKIPTPEKVPLVLENIENIRWSYGLAKTVGEMSCYAANHQLGLNFKILRIHNAYGPRMGNKHVIPDLISKFKNNIMEVPGFNESRAFMYIDDLVEIIDYLVFKSESSLKLINIGSSKETLIKDLAMKLLAIMNINADLIPMDSWTGSVKRRLPDTSLLRSIYPFTETFLDDGLRKTVAWYEKKS